VRVLLFKAVKKEITLTLYRLQQAKRLAEKIGKTSLFDGKMASPVRNTSHYNSHYNANLAA
jgi:hypothetical protein